MNLDLRFTANEVAQVLKWPPQQVARLGQSVRTASAPLGKGHRAQYSLRNIIELQIIEELMRFGVPHKRILYYLQSLAKSKAALDWLLDEAGCWIVCDGDSQWSVGEQLHDAVNHLKEESHYRAAIIVHLAGMRTFTFANIQELKRGR